MQTYKNTKTLREQKMKEKHLQKRFDFILHVTTIETFCKMFYAIKNRAGHSNYKHSIKNQFYFMRKRTFRTSATLFLALKKLRESAHTTIS